MVREIVIPQTREYVLHIPGEYLNRQVEILVLPFDERASTQPRRKPLTLTTFRCGGVYREFSRRDAYRDALSGGIEFSNQ